MVSRFAFHHFERPAAVLAGMKRVCKPGGKLVVCDLLASDDVSEAERFHAMEMMRDPSHARALRLDELVTSFVEADLSPAQPVFYRLAFQLEAMLGRSFPSPEHVPAIRAAFEASLAGAGLGLDTRRVRDDIHGAYRVAIQTAGC